MPADAPEMADARPVIGFIGCGGTIGSVAADPLDVIDYPEHGLKISAGDLLARVPDAARFASFKVRDFSRVSSSAIGPAEWLQLRRHVLALAAEGVRGIVITHGTGTLEETAFFLHLTLDLDIPVVLTGAQRPVSAVGSDAPANLIAAVRVACTQEARGLGVLVVLNDEIHSAGEVVKTSTYRLQTFQSPETGPLGTVDGDRVVIRHRPCARPEPFSPAAGEGAGLPPVYIAYSYAGADGTAIRAAVAAGARGIISAGFAPGIPAPDEAAAMAEAQVGGVMLVQSSRALHGRVAERRGLSEKGWLPANSLNAQKARVLLMLCLEAGLSHADTKARFAAFG